jgi:ATP-dependent exoDNAse (exonuclease V) alpha subunit
VGKAGSGKSHALAAAREAWQASGTPVLGAAVAARAALALSEAAGMPALTVARLLAQIDTGQLAGQGGGQVAGLPHGVVLVVDEAGMLGTRQLARLLTATSQARGKLVLVGDHGQLPELAAGGAFRGLARRMRPVLLRQNHRQIHGWERVALDKLRAGHVDAGLDAYTNAGRVTISATSDAQRAALVAAWWQAQKTTDNALGAGVGAVMLAARRADVADLNARARELLAAAGRLRGPTIQVAGDDRQRCFAVGDIVIARRNDYTTGLLNGQRGLVTHIDPDRGTLTVRTDAGLVAVGRAYLTAGGLDHGYALTIHQAQGLTTNHGLVLGSDSLYRESGYVALSRGRIRNDLYLAARTDNLDPVAADSHVPQPPDTSQDPLAHLVSALERSRGQTMAIDLLATRPAQTPEQTQSVQL